MNYPPHSNDPNDPHSQPTIAGQYPPWGQLGQPSNPQWGQPDPTTAGQSLQPDQLRSPSAQSTLKQRFRALPKWKQIGGIGCGCLTALILFLTLCAIVGNALPKQHNTSQLVASGPTQQPTHPEISVKKPAPTPMPIPTMIATPTATPTVVSVQPTQDIVSGPPILGADIGTFISKYGQPNDHSTVNTGSYHFQRYSGINIDFLIVQTDVVDGGIYTKRVQWVTANTSDTGDGWSQQQADTTCATFLPSDVVYKQEVQISGGGYDKIYFSPSLASMFPTSSFTDASQNQVQAGLFDVQYLTKSASDPNIVSCSILIGTQQTQ